VNGLLLEQPFPGTTTCVLIGGLRDRSELAFNRYRHLFWLSDNDRKGPAPVGIASDHIQRIAVEITTPAALAIALETFVRYDPRRLPSVYVTASIAGPHEAVYRQAIAEIHAVLEDTHRARLTRQKDGFVWQKHLLANAETCARHRIPANWAGALGGLPAFVVGAGPSLDVSLAKLAAVAERGVVFAADSALRALALHGMAADFAVSIDAAKIPDKCLPPGTPMPRRMILCAISPPAWQKAIPSDRLGFVSSRQITEDWLVSLGIARPEIRAMENCGSTAIELARFLGCNPVYLFGLDLAVTAADQTRRHHRDADPTLYTQSNYNPAVQLPLVPGNYADQVPTFALGDWRALDERLAARTSPHVFNVNDRGARFRGTTLMHPDQFTLDALEGAKHAALAAVAPLESDSPTISAALTRLRTTAAKAHRALPDLQCALDRGGPAALAAAFRPLLTDRECSRFLGAFALKLMPHLVPPIEGDAAFWRKLVTEFAELTTFAEPLAGQTGDF
jgi:hypothetical protein